MNSLDSPIFKPFDNIDQFYIGIYIFYKFKHLEKKQNQLFELVQTFTKKIDLTVQEFEWFIEKISLNSKCYYATEIFKNLSELENEISKHLLTNNVKMNSQEVINFEPFNNIDQFYAGMYLFYKFEHLEKKYPAQLFELIKSLTNKNDLTQIDFEWFLNKIKVNSKNVYASSFFISLNCLETEISNYLLLSNTLNLHFKVSLQSCLICNKTLNSEENSYQTLAVVYFCSNTAQECSNSYVLCKICKIKYYYSYYINNENQRFFYKNFFEQKYVSFTNSTFYEKKVFDMLTSDIMFKHSSMKGFCDSYNSIFSNNNLKRGELERVRLSECWYYYHLLKLVKETKSLKDYSAPFIERLDDELENLRPNLFSLFTRKWSNNHHCKNPNCSKILAVDGIWKINRLKCMFENGHIITEELDPIQIGCPYSPEQGSYYCSLHKVNEPYLSFKINGVLTPMRLSSIKTSNIKKGIEIKKIHDVYCINKREEENDDEEENNVDVIYLVETVDIKQTFSWVKENFVSQEMLDKFNSDNLESTEKGVFEEPNCKTNKHFGIPYENKKRTRGLLVSSFNCGIVNGYREIFGSESVRQVVLFYLDLIDKIFMLPGV